MTDDQIKAALDGAVDAFVFPMARLATESVLTGKPYKVTEALHRRCVAAAIAGALRALPGDTFGCEPYGDDPARIADCQSLHELAERFERIAKGAPDA